MAFSSSSPSNISTASAALFRVSSISSRCRPEYPTKHSPQYPMPPASGRFRPECAKILPAKSVNDRAHSVVAAGPSGFTNPDLPDRKIHIIIDDQTASRQNFVIGQRHRNSVTAEIHIGQRLEQNALPTGDPSLSYQSFMAETIDGYLMASGQYIQNHKAAIMPIALMFSADCLSRQSARTVLFRPTQSC